MSIVFDQEKGFSYIHRYVNGAWDTTNYATSTAWDLFPDNAQVGDYIVFGNRNTGWSYHDIKFNIGTALSATSITIVWEKYTYTNTWTAIPNVTDNTNAFQNTGVNTVEFDIPENMSGTTYGWDYYLYPYYQATGTRHNGNWIRARITAVSGLTEGGRTQTDRVKCKDATITVNNENFGVADLQSACDSGSWEIRNGVKAVETLGNFTLIRAHLNMTGSSSWSDTHKAIQMGENKYRAGFRNLGTGTIKLGELDASGRGKNGCYLDMYALFDSAYDYVYGVQAFGSVIHRTGTRYGAFDMGKVFKMVDSSFNSPNRWYLTGYLSAGSEWTRSVYANNDLLYLYSGKLAFDAFESLDAWQGVLCGTGRPATFKNTNFNGKKIMRYYGADVDMIDCTNIDYSKITSTTPYGYPSLHVRIKYTINYHIIDKDNNNVQGATVVLKDKNGTETFSVITDANGKIAEQTVMVYDKYWVKAESWAEHNDDYNDFALEIKAGGKSYVMDKFTIDAPIDDKLQLQGDSRINVDQEEL